MAPAPGNTPKAFWPPVPAHPLTSPPPPRPNRRQRVRARSPRVLELQLIGRLLRFQILARRRTTDVRLHRAQRDVASALIFLHESVILLFGYQGARLRLPNPLESFNCRHWKILIVVRQLTAQKYYR